MCGRKMKSFIGICGGVIIFACVVECHACEAWKKTRFACGAKGNITWLPVRPEVFPGKYICCLCDKKREVRHRLEMLENFQKASV